MPQYQVHIDTDNASYKVMKDGKEMGHEHMSCGMYTCADDQGQDGIDFAASVKKTKQYIHMSHSSKDKDTGATHTHTYAFYLGDQDQSYEMMSPTNGIPSAVAKVVETSIAAHKMEKFLTDKK